MFVRVVDFETTGLEPATSDVVEVGWTDGESDGTISFPQSVIVKPTRAIELEAMAVHHLTEKDVVDGVSGEHWRGALLDGGPAAFVAHYAKFESAFWADCPLPWICTYKSALRVWPDAPRHSNQVLRYWLGLDNDLGTFNPVLAMPPHRAEADSYLTAHIFVRLLRAEGDHRLSRLAAWSRMPAILPKVTFGKHRGMAWSEVPRDYLRWIENQADMDEDVKFTASQELARR